MIYILEDDDSIRDLVVYTLSRSGFSVKGFALPSEFWKALKAEIPDLLLLDIMLPEEDGIQILKALRQGSLTRKLPIIMLTAKGTEYDRVFGLDSGADDYIPKPFGMMELIARINALLRRASDTSEPEQYVAGSISLCPAKRTVYANNNLVSLTNKEFELLLHLIRLPGILITREQLLLEIWGYTFDAESRTLDVHIRTLRQKLGASGNQIETVRGAGYRLREECE